MIGGVVNGPIIGLFTVRLALMLSCNYLLFVFLVSATPDTIRPGGDGGAVGGRPGRPRRLPLLRPGQSTLHPLSNCLRIQQSNNPTV